MPYYMIAIIVFLPTGYYAMRRIRKMMQLVDASVNDISIGKQVMANGIPNQDGSLTAQMI